MSSTLPHRTRRADPGVAALAPLLIKELYAPKDSPTLVLRGLCVALVGLMTDSPRKTESLAQRASALLAEHSREAIGAGDIARLLDVDRTHLARTFRRENNRTISTHLRMLRLADAMSMLAQTDRPIVDIALCAGFSDQSHLTRVFGEFVGTAPARWRAQHRSPKATSIQDLALRN